MKSPKEVEDEYFEKINEQGKTKISLNLGNKTLEMLEDWTDIFGINRTVAIETLIQAGIPEYIKQYKKSDKKVRKMKEFSDKKEELDKRLEKIKEFKEKWDI